MDGYRSKLVNVVSGVPQGNVFETLVFPLFTLEFFSILENKLVGYADDSTVMTAVPSPRGRVIVGESLIHDLSRISEWWDLWRMKFNASRPWL